MATNKIRDNATPNRQAIFGINIPIGNRGSVTNNSTGQINISDIDVKTGDYGYAKNKGSYIDRVDSIPSRICC